MVRQLICLWICGILLAPNLALAQAGSQQAVAGIPTDTGTLTVRNGNDGGVWLSLEHVSVTVKPAEALALASWIKNGKSKGYDTVGPVAVSRDGEWLVVVMAPSGEPPTKVRIRGDVAIQLADALASSSQNIADPDNRTTP